jgi:hypothetical protein
MSLLRKVTSRGTPSALGETSETSCPHTALVPRWDSAEDMGKQDRATAYFCEGCERTFTAEEAKPYLP